MIKIVNFEEGSELTGTVAANFSIHLEEQVHNVLKISCTNPVYLFGRCVQTGCALVWFFADVYSNFYRYTDCTSFMFISMFIY